MWPNSQETADLVTFIEKILNGKFNFLGSGYFYKIRKSQILVWKTEKMISPS